MFRAPLTRRVNARPQIPSTCLLFHTSEAKDISSLYNPHHESPGGALPRRFPEWLRPSIILSAPTLARLNHFLYQNKRILSYILCSGASKSDHIAFLRTTNSQANKVPTQVHTMVVNKKNTHHYIQCYILSAKGENVTAEIMHRSY